jgi:cytochrome c553
MFRIWGIYTTLLLAGLAILAPLSVTAATGDPVRGKQLSRECFACHGEDGNSPSPVNPKIGGQHPEYLLLAMQAYRGGSRTSSLMRGAVLNKSEDELKDIAAYFGAQSPASPRSKKRGAPGRGGFLKFDHGERDAAFTSMLARAAFLAANAKAIDESACHNMPSSASTTIDSDGDGVADRYDAEPKNPLEFVRDTNKDGSHEICNVEQLQAIATFGSNAETAEDLQLKRSYQLARDLDAGGIDAFEPIGNCGPTGNCMVALGQFGFAGAFDGQGHVISNLTVTKPEGGGISLFGVLGESGVVMNLQLENADISGRAGVGGLVGSNFGVLFNTRVSGQVSGSMAIGGLVGGSGGLVYQSKFEGTVNGQQAAGGLVGDMTGAVYYSHSGAVVNGKRGIGGLIGLNTFGSVRGSYATGAVNGENDVGGLAGVNTNGKIRSSYATGTVTGLGYNVGGLIGFNSLGSVHNSYATGRVNGAAAAGSLVGRNNGAISNSFAMGTGTDGIVVGAVVEGESIGVFSNAGLDLAALDGAETGWNPSPLPTGKLLNYFCDNNRNGFIDPDEYSADNFVWDLGSNRNLPALRCVDGGLAEQRGNPVNFERLN